MWFVCVVAPRGERERGGGGDAHVDCTTFNLVLNNQKTQTPVKIILINKQFPEFFRCRTRAQPTQQNTNLEVGMVEVALVDSVAVLESISNKRYVCVGDNSRRLCLSTK